MEHPWTHRYLEVVAELDHDLRGVGGAVTNLAGLLPGGPGDDLETLVRCAARRSLDANLALTGLARLLRGIPGSRPGTPAFSVFAKKVRHRLDELQAQVELSADADEDSQGRLVTEGAVDLATCALFPAWRLATVPLTATLRAGRDEWVLTVHTGDRVPAERLRPVLSGAPEGKANLPDVQLTYALLDAKRHGGTLSYLDRGAVELRMPWAHSGSR